MALPISPHGPFVGLGLRRITAIVGDSSNERNAMPAIWDCADTVPAAQPAGLFEPFISNVAMTIENISMATTWLLHMHISRVAQCGIARAAGPNGETMKNREPMWDIPGDCTGKQLVRICND